MSDLGKTLYMAASVLLFIVAATTSIYLYSSVNTYLSVATDTVSIQKRAEMSSSMIDLNYKREITKAEVFMMIYNMENMHVEKVEVVLGDNRYEVTLDDVNENKIDINLRYLLENNNYKFIYSSNGTTVTYTLTNS